MTAPPLNSEKVLQLITAVKLGEVDNQRLKYQDMAKTVLDSTGSFVGGDKESLLRRVNLLVNAVIGWEGPNQLEGTTVGEKLDLQNLRSWMEQARNEAGFDLKVIKGWEEILVAHMHHTNARFDAAKLFWEMYHEWIESEDIKVVSQPLKEAGEIEVDAIEEGFDMMLDAPGVEASNLPLHLQNQGHHTSSPEKKTIEEKERVASLILNEYPTDTEELTTYLDDLFGSEDAKVALSRVRASLYAFGSLFQMATIDRHTIAQAISGLLAMGQMDGNQRVILKEIQSSEVALQEVANILQIRLVDLRSWKWPKEEKRVDVPKHAGENLSTFADLHIVDMILWEYIGNRWREEMKTALRKVFDSHAWKRSKVSAEQFNAMCTLESLSPNDSINTKREKMRSRYFFLPNLNNPATTLAINDDFAEMQQREKDIRTRSLSMFRRILLHSMATESRLNNVLHGSHTIVRMRLEDLEHSLSHQSILIILAYLGVPEDWISNFNSFLAMPIPSADTSTSRACKRGTPLGYTLSVVIREAVLHIMDFAVNQRADRVFLHRIGDDVWFWDASADICSKAQREMEIFASLFGIKLNAKKIGTSRPAMSEARPMEEVKWGFLKFDPDQIGFVIDQEEVDLQITEFRYRLAATSSIIGWVEMYNKYIGHFWRNFGGLPADCLGDGFVDDMIDTFARIHRKLFLEPDIGPVGYLRKIVGLDIYNVVLCLTSLERGKGPSHSSNTFIRPAGRSNALSPPSNLQYSPAVSRFANQFYNDLNDYTALVSRWKVKECGRSEKSMPVGQAFISFGEYASLRECHLMSWGNLYDSMFHNLRPKVVSAGSHPNPTRSAFAAARCRGTESYSRWVVSIYGEDVIKRFGTMNIVDKLLIPAAMTDVSRN